jgi:ankyrin repeat protein
VKKKSPPTRTLRERPDLQQLRRQAKELLAAFASGDAAASVEVSGRLHGADRATFALHNAQFVLARSYGFDSWPKLKAYVDGVTVHRLAEAVEAGDVRLVAAMLKARPELVNYDQAENDERRPIHFAVLARNVEMTRLLMRLGADARAGIYPHRPATNARAIARERGYTEIAAIIDEEERQRPSPVRQRFEGEPQTDAEAAIERNDAEWLRARHAEGALAPGVLTAAVKLDRPEMLALLLDLGFDPDEPTRVENVEEFVRSAGSPLWHCAEGGKMEMARMLLERGAAPNVHVYACGSSVYSAYRAGQRPMIDLLKQFGGVVDPVTVGLFGETELAREMLAAEAAGKRLPPGILEGRNVSEDLLRGAADAGHAKIVRMALPGVDWPRDDDRWSWILMQPIWPGRPDILAILLERCDVARRRLRFGRTILHDVAALGGDEAAARSGEMAQLLLDAGAPMNVRDDLLRSTPLGWACRWGRTEMVRVLIERGADREEADGENWARPKAWAEKMGHTDLLKLLGKL